MENRKLKDKNRSYLMCALVEVQKTLPKDDYRDLIGGFNSINMGSVSSKSLEWMDDKK